MGIEDVLSWLSRRLVCGTLTLENAAVVRSFICDSGYLTSASGNVPREELGQVLLDRGLVDATSLEEARLVQADTGVSLSRILLMVGKVDEERLRAVLEDQALAAMLDVFTWDDGTFAIERGDRAPASSEPEIAVQLRVCIEEGKRRAARWREIQERLPNPEAVLRVADRDRLVAPGDTAAQRAEAAVLIEAVDQELSIEQIAAELEMPRFRILDRLCALVERGALAVPVEPADDPDVPAEVLAEESRRLAAGGDRLGAFDLASRALAREPDSEAMQDLFHAAERALFAELSRELLASFRVPRLLVARGELEQLELSESERYLAGRVDGRWDLLSLMRASPLREAEALITFKRLADRGVISL